MEWILEWMVQRFMEQILASVLFGLMLAVLASCCVFYHAFKLPQHPKRKVDAFIARALPGPLAHRGGTPENTLAAITRSSQLGCVGFEVDLAFTKDGAAVLLHDDQVDRTSNGKGRVRDMTLQEVKKLDFGKSAGPVFCGEPIPTLKEAIDLCEQQDLLMLLELKGFRDTAKALKLVKNLFSEKPYLYNRIAVISFYPNVVYKLRRQDRNLLVGLVTRSKVLSTRVDRSRRSTWCCKHLVTACADMLLTFSINTWLWRFLGISLLIANKNDILGGRVIPADWNKSGVGLIAWTVNSTQEMNHFKSILKIPFLTDNVERDKSFPEQAC